MVRRDTVRNGMFPWTRDGKGNHTLTRTSPAHQSLLVINYWSNWLAGVCQSILPTWAPSQSKREQGTGGDRNWEQPPCSWRLYLLLQCACLVLTIAHWLELIWLVGGTPRGFNDEKKMRQRVGLRLGQCCPWRGRWRLKKKCVIGSVAYIQLGSFLEREVTTHAWLELEHVLFFMPPVLMCLFSKTPTQQSECSKDTLICDLNTSVVFI